MKNRVFLFAITIFICSCQGNQDEDFRSFYAQFQKQVESQPLMRAFLEGKLAFDSTLVRCAPVEVDSLSARVNRHFQYMAQFSKDRLSPELYLYHQRTRDFLTVLAKRLEVDQVHRTDPSFYDPRPRLAFLLKNKQPLEHTLQTLTANYKSAENLLSINTLAASDSAVQQGIAVYKLLNNEIKNKLESPATNTNLPAQLNEAKLATKSFIGLANSFGFERRDSLNIQ